MPSTSPSLGDVLTGWQWDPATAVVIVVAAVAYWRGVRRLARRGRRWPRSRSVAWVGALAAGGLATMSGLGRYDSTSFTSHMGQHALLAMAVPLLAVLATPVTLLLQAGGPATTRLARQALHSRWGRTLSHPVVGFALFGGGLVVVYLTPVLEVAARNDVVHIAVHTHLLLSGWLYLAPIVGADALPRVVPYGLRLVAILAAVPFHAFLGVVLLTASSPLAPDAYPSLADQRDAAGVLWATGELLSLALVAVVVRQWWRADSREAGRSDRRQDDRAARWADRPIDAP